MAERACEKCGGTDVLVEFKRAGHEFVNWINESRNIRCGDWPEGTKRGDDGVVATRDVLRVHCRTCRWWWTEEPGSFGETRGGIDGLKALAGEWLRLAGESRKLAEKYSGDATKLLGHAAIFERCAKELCAALTIPSTANGDAVATSAVECVFCRKPITAAEMEDGHPAPTCELNDGRWVCSSDCWDRAVRMWDEPAEARGEVAP